MVRSAVSSYLRRRHYTDADHFRKSDLVLSQNCKQMTLAAAVVKDSSRLNSIIFSSINNDITQAELQFTKIKSWISELTEEDCRNELSVLLFPLFCHLYLEILRGGHRQATSKFLKRHQEMFAGKESCRGLIEELSSVFTTQDIDTRPVIKAFRSCKYEIKLSSRTMAHLRKYLTFHSHVILLQVLQTWFDIEVKPDSSVLEEEEDTMEVEQEVSSTSSFNTESQNQVPEEKEMAQLLEAIRQVRESPCLPSPLLLYSLHNSENVCCATVSQSVKVIASGYQTSKIQLWSLNETKLVPGIVNYACVSLACDTEFRERQAPERNSVTLRGHSSTVCSVAFIPDTDVLLSTSHDTTMRAWNLNTYTPIALYRGHNYPVWCVAVSSFGVHIATGSHDRTARLWNLDRTYPLRIFAGHNLDVNCVQFHPNSHYLATGSADKSIRLWSVTDGSLVRVFGGHSGSIQALAFSPNGQYLASAGDDRRVRVWDLAASSVLADFRGHTQPVTAVDWSKDGNTLASSSMDGSVLVWNVGTKLKNLSSDNVEHPTKYSTQCSSLLSLQYMPRNVLVTIGTATSQLQTST